MSNELFSCLDGFPKAKFNKPNLNSPFLKASRRPYTVAHYNVARVLKIPLVQYKERLDNETAKFLFHVLKYGSNIILVM